MAIIMGLKTLRMQARILQVMRNMKTIHTLHLHPGHHPRITDTTTALLMIHLLTVGMARNDLMMIEFPCFLGTLWTLHHNLPAHYLPHERFLRASRLCCIL